LKYNNEILNFDVIEQSNIVVYIKVEDTCYITIQEHNYVEKYNFCLIYLILDYVHIVNIDLYKTSGLDPPMPLRKQVA